MEDPLDLAYRTASAAELGEPITWFGDVLPAVRGSGWFMAGLVALAIWGAVCLVLVPVLVVVIVGMVR